MKLPAPDIISVISVIFKSYFSQFSVVFQSFFSQLIDELVVQLAMGPP